MKCIIGGKIILPHTILDDTAIVFSDKIEAIIPAKKALNLDCEMIAADGCYIAPGLVDIHIHGYLGEDSSDGNVQGLLKMSKGLAQQGVTSWCPTTMTLQKNDLLRAFDAVRYVKSLSGYGARIIGVNAEGPFINPLKKGAQNEKYISCPDANFIVENDDIIKLFTIAPELEGALQCIERIRSSTDIVASLGHTNADFLQAMAAVEAGATHITHLFNTMSPLHHRSPGIITAALNEDRLYCELIADTIHVDKTLFNIIAKLKGDRLCLITDCIRAGGMPDGVYSLGEQPVYKKGELCTLSDGTVAGSVLTLINAVKNLYNNSSLTINEAFSCASINPAKAIKEDENIGSLEKGKTADIIICDNDLNIISTYISGEKQ